MYITESVTQDVGTNFSVSLESACKENQHYGCEIAYILSAAKTTEKITVIDEGHRVTGKRAGNVLTYYYAYVINNRRTVTFNLTIASSAQPVVVCLSSQYQLNCVQARSIASIQFKGE